MGARRALFVAATALLALAAVEAVAFLGLRFVSGRWVAHADLAGERAARSAGVVGGADAQEAQQRGELSVKRALHPFVGWVKDADEPDLFLGSTNPEARELGFPQNAHPIILAPDPDRVVVAVLGGSVAASFARNGGQALLDRIAGSERFAGREPILLSLALPGFKQPQQLMTLAWLLALGAHFDVVVNIDGYNELLASVYNYEGKGVFPAYPKRWFERVGDLEGDLRLAVGEIAYVQDLRRERSELFSRAPLRWSLLAGLVWKLLDRGLEAQLARAQARMEAGDPAERYQARGPRQTFASTDALLDEIAAVWARSSLEMHALATAHGAEYHHFLQPNQYVEDSKILTPRERARAYQAGSRREALVRAGYPKLQREGAKLAARGVSFHDLTGLFQGVSETLYIDVCCHVNRLGNERIAGAIAGALDAH